MRAELSSAFVEQFLAGKSVFRRSKRGERIVCRVQVHFAIGLRRQNRISQNLDAAINKIDDPVVGNARLRIGRSFRSPIFGQGAIRNLNEQDDGPRPWPGTDIVGSLSPHDCDAGFCLRAWRNQERSLPSDPVASVAGLPG